MTNHISEYPPCFPEFFPDFFPLASDFDDQSDQRNQSNQIDNFSLGLWFWWPEWPKQPKEPKWIFLGVSLFDDQSNQSDQSEFSRGLFFRWPKQPKLSFLPSGLIQIHSFKARRLKLCVWPLFIVASVKGYMRPASEAVSWNALSTSGVKKSKKDAFFDLVSGGAWRHKLMPEGINLCLIFKLFRFRFSNFLDSDFQT